MAKGQKSSAGPRDPAVKRCHGWRKVHHGGGKFYIKFWDSSGDYFKLSPQNILYLTSSNWQTRWWEFSLNCFNLPTLTAPPANSFAVQLLTFPPIISDFTCVKHLLTAACSVLGLCFCCCSAFSYWHMKERGSVHMGIWKSREHPEQSHTSEYDILPGNIYFF